MTAGSVAPLARLTRLSRTMEIVTIVGMVFIVGGMLAAFLIPDWTRNLVLAKLGLFGTTLPLPPLSRLAVAAIMAVPVGVLLYGLLAVRALFREFAQGHVFTERAALKLQTFAATVLAQAPLGPLTAAALSAALSWANPPGQRAVHITLSTNDYLALIVGGVLFAVATVMREASRLADENASFV
jgi:Protein of unknown function (DUF2975)